MGIRGIFILTFFCLAITSVSYSQVLQLDELEQHPIKNASLLHPLFEKFIKLEENKEGKINIVHIGDSHIQADFFTNAVRKPLQQQFGNGGYGFTFPYNLNGPARPYRFATNVAWQICRNNRPARCDSGTEFGLSGYGFNTQASQFVLSVEASEERFRFNTIKIIAPEATSYRLAAIEGDKKPMIHNVRSSVEIHKVKSRETLDAIAKNYRVSAAAIKRENNMKSNKIWAGKNLRIPITITETSTDTSLFLPLEFQWQEKFVSAYHQDNPISAIYLLQTGKQNFYNLNGFIVENDAPGVIYHSIGTVGSMASDFNATPLFFEQLPVLSPDFVIISFGTNESYSDVTAEEFIAQMELFINNIKAFCPEIPILVTTPPTSLLRRRRLNNYVLEYSDNLMQRDDIALWDLYSFTGGLMGAEENFAAIQITKDYIHYTSKGYVNQGTAFANSLLSQYEHYKRNRE